MQTFILEDLLPNQYYNAQVEAVFTEGCSVVSPAVSFKTAHVNTPSFPILLLPLVIALSTMLTTLILHYQEFVIHSWYDIHMYILCIHFTHFVLSMCTFGLNSYAFVSRQAT